MRPLQSLCMLTAFSHYSHLARLYAVGPEQQLRSDTAPSVTRSSSDEWNINSCSGGCNRGRAVTVLCALPKCVRTDEGEGGRIPVDILIGRRCQMPASKGGRSGL